MRNHHNSAVKVLQRHGQSLAHFQIQVVRGLVQQEQVGSLPRDHGQRHASFFATGKRPDGTQSFIAMKIKAAKEIPYTLL